MTKSLHEMPYYRALQKAVAEADAPVILEAFGKDGERIAEARQTSCGILWDGQERLKIFEANREHAPGPRAPVAYERVRFLIDWDGEVGPGDIPDALPGAGRRSGNCYFARHLVLARIAAGRGNRVKVTLADCIGE